MRKVQFVNADALWRCFSADSVRPTTYFGVSYVNVCLLGGLGCCAAHKKKKYMCMQSR